MQSSLTEKRKKQRFSKLLILGCSPYYRRILRRKFLTKYQRHRLRQRLPSKMQVPNDGRFWKLSPGGAGRKKDSVREIRKHNGTVSVCQEAKQSSHEVLQGRRPLHHGFVNNLSSDEDLDDRRRPFFYKRIKVRPSQTSNMSRRKVASNHAVKAISSDDEDVQFIKEFKNVKTESPSSMNRTSLAREVVVKKSLNSNESNEHTLESSAKVDSPFTSIHVQVNMHPDHVVVGNRVTRKVRNYDEIFSAEKNDHKKNCHTQHDSTPHRRIAEFSANNIDLKPSNRTVELIKDEEKNNDDDDDDLIVVQNDDASKQSIDYLTLKRIVISMVCNNADEDEESRKTITIDYVLQRLKALYHQDFSNRLLEIQYCLRRARERCSASRKSLQHVRPGVRKSDINTLAPQGLLNDVIINHYMSILVEHSNNFGAISSFCYEEILRGKEPSVPRNWRNMSRVLIPTCISKHWSLMSLLPDSMDIAIYNSMQVTEDEIQCANIFLNFFRVKANLKGVGKCVKVQDLPQQENEYDCGVYVCMFARCIVHGNSFEIKAPQVREFRKWLKLEISQGRLLGAKGDTTDTMFETSSESETERVHRREESSQLDSS